MGSATGSGTADTRRRTTTPRRGRRAMAAAAAAGVLGGAAAARAQSVDPTNGDTAYAYTGAAGTATNPATDNWSTAGAFNGSSLSAANLSGGNLELFFGGSGTAAYTSTNDLGAVTVNAVQLNSTSSATNTIAGGQLNFAVYNNSGTLVQPTITQNGTGAFTIANNISVAAPVANATYSALTIAGAGTGPVTLSGTLSFGAFTSTATSNNVSAASLLINGSSGAATTVNLTGTATFVPSTINAYGSVSAAPIPFSGGINVLNGTLNITGAGSVVANISNGTITQADSTLRLGGAAGVGILNVNTTGTITVSAPEIGGDYLPGPTGNPTTMAATGVVNQLAGTVYYSVGSQLNNFLSIGAGYTTQGQTGGYGAYNLAGGTLSANGNANGGGVRVGAVGEGVLIQTGGTIAPARFFQVGTFGTGVATFTGGTVVGAGSSLNGGLGYATVVADTAGVGTFNLGTEAGGNVLFENQSTQTGTFGSAGSPSASGSTTAQGFVISNGSTLGTTVGVVNLDSGTLQLAGGIGRGSYGTAVLNLNGATIQATASQTTGYALINSTGTAAVSPTTASGYLPATVYRGGITVDTQTYTSAITAPLVAAAGNGLYPSAGAITSGLTFTGGSPNAGYIAPPLVTVIDQTTGVAVAATAVANVSGGQVTAVTLTSPGQGYQVGDVLQFNFSGGEQGTAAGYYTTTATYTLKAADVAANGGGPLTKLGTGTLTMTGADTYSGNTVVTAGTLRVNGTTLSTGTVLVPTAGTLGGNGSVGAVVVAGTITAGPSATAVGNLSTGAQTWNASGSYAAKLVGTTSDRLVMSGLTVNATAGSPFVVNLTGTNASTGTGTYVLAVDKGATSGDPFSLAALSLTVNGAAAPSNYALSEGTDTTGAGGYDLFLTTAAPEPASLLLVGVGVAPLAVGRRRRRAAR